LRGEDMRQGALFSYRLIEDRFPSEHGIRKLREYVDQILERLSPEFDKIYSREGRPSIPPERLLRALLLQVIYTIRSERQLMEQLDYNLRNPVNVAPGSGQSGPRPGKGLMG